MISISKSNKELRELYHIEELDQYCINDGTLNCRSMYPYDTLYDYSKFLCHTGMFVNSTICDDLSEVSSDSIKAIDLKSYSVQKPQDYYKAEYFDGGISFAIDHIGPGRNSVQLLTPKTNISLNDISRMTK